MNEIFCYLFLRKQLIDVDTLGQYEQKYYRIIVNGNKRQ